MNIRYINLDAYGAQSLLIDVYKFNFNTRFISNYLSKEIRRLKITGDGTYNMISVRLSDTQSEVELSYGGDRKDVLAIKLHMSEKEQHAYNAMTDLNERYELYLNLLEKGYILASQIKKVPLNVLLELHDKFRSNNYSRCF